MKFFLLSAFMALWASFALHGQGDACGYVASPAYYQRLLNPTSDLNLQVKFLKQYTIENLVKFNRLDVQAPGQYKLELPKLNGTGFNRNLHMGAWMQQHLNEQLQQSAPRIIPIVAHIVRRRDGSNGLKPSELNAALAETNKHYRRLRMRFVVCEINYINDDGLANTPILWANNNDHTILNVRARNRARKLNIYFVPNSNTSWAPYPNTEPDDQHILMNNGQAKNGTTLSHEIGHWFGLVHTHGRSNNGTTDEPVNGANCDRTGDGICDTPADPGLDGRVNGNCQYTGGSAVRDANGQTYNPDVPNLMSYSRDCRNRFSREQLISMLRAYFRMGVERGYTFEACNNSGTFLFVGNQSSFYNYYGLSKQGLRVPQVDALRESRNAMKWVVPIRMVHGVNVELHYDCIKGEGRFYKVDPNRTRGEELSHRTGWRKTWDIILQHGNTILFYDRGTGSGEFYALKRDGTMGQRLSTTKNWRKSWDIINSYDGKLTFYDRAKGEMAYYSSNPDGTLGRLIELRRGRKTWNTIDTYKVGRQRYMFYYDKNAGVIEYYRVNSNGVIGTRIGSVRARKTWNNIVPYVENGRSYCLFYDSKNRTGEFNRFNSNGTLGPIVKQLTGWSQGWQQFLHFPKAR